MIKTTVMGYGTIGSGVAEILDKNRGVIAGQARQKVELKYILDLRGLQDSPVADKIVHDFKVIQQGEEVKTMVGTIGELDPTYPLVKACLMAGKYVVTSSKALVTARDTELSAIVKKEDVNFFFGASVGGGIPIIRSLYRYLVGGRIEEITGILNRITNFILTKMNKEGESFENALKEAQNLEYAEHNPEVDVGGHNTCRRTAILTTMVTGKEVDYEDTYTEGITRITDIDLKYAEKMGTSVKLFRTSRIKDSRVLIYVTPMTTNKTSPLYSVNDVFNGILIKGNMLGISMLYGSGAGKLPTGSAMIANIIEAAQDLKRNMSMGWTGGEQATESMDQAQLRCFVRVVGSYCNKEQNVKGAFGQVEVIELYGMDEFAFLTAQMTEGELKKGVVSYDARGWEQSEHDIKQVMRTVLQHMVSVISRIIGVVTRQGFPCLFHLLTGLYCPSYGGTRAFRALLTGNLLLSIRYYPLVAYMTVVLTIELVSFEVFRAAKNPRYYLRREKFLVYTGTAIALVNWVYKNHTLMVRGVDLLPLWPC